MSGKHHDSEHPGPESYAALRTKALESLLVEKGVITTDVIDTVVRAYEQDIGPLNGAQVVARAWIDPAYKNACWQTAPQPSLRWALGAAKGLRWWCWRTPQRYTTLSCAPCARAIPGQC